MRVLEVIAPAYCLAGPSSAKEARCVHQASPEQGFGGVCAPKSLFGNTCGRGTPYGPPCVTLQRRFNPIYTTFCQLYDQIGRPFVLDAEYTVYTDDPASGWRGDVSLAGGGCIIDMGYHMIDMLLWYFGLPDRVLAGFSAAARPDLDYDAEDARGWHSHRVVVARPSLACCGD
ncbi:MAG: Gfo/Idh/MocA family protein [Egibacteraceae bacterium]